LSRHINNPTDNPTRVVGIGRSVRLHTASNQTIPPSGAAPLPEKPDLRRTLTLKSEAFTPEFRAFIGHEEVVLDWFFDMTGGDLGRVVLAGRHLALNGLDPDSDVQGRHEVRRTGCIVNHPREALDALVLEPRIENHLAQVAHPSLVGGGLGVNVPVLAVTLGPHLLGPLFMLRRDQERNPPLRMDLAVCHRNQPSVA
jgi:hypothetical protein